MGFLVGLTVLLSYQLLGEVMALYLQLPVPGPVVGMILLFLTLWIRGRSSPDLDHSASGLLTHLSLLFVPAGVGAMVHVERIGREWLPIVAALVGSTLLTLVFTALFMKALQRWSGSRSGAHE